MQLTVPAVGTAPGGVTSLTCQTWKRNTKYPAGRERDRRRITRPIATRTRPNTASADRSRSYVTHLAEDGFPEKFVSEQVGHAYVSTTALYTSVSDDFKNRVLAKALEPAFAAGAGRGR